jgi:hypothetical protein
MAQQDSLRNKILSGIIVSAIVAVFGYVGRSWWPPIGRWFLSVILIVWHFLLRPHQVFGWLLVILCFTAFYCVLRLITAVRRPERLTWRDYKEDSFFDILWRWDYGYRGEIHRAVPFCLRCDTQIVPQLDMDYGPWGRREVTYFICDHCDGTHLKLEDSLQDIESKVIRQIARNLRNDSWKARIRDFIDADLRRGKPLTPP